MQKINGVLYAGLTPFLFSCDQQPPAPDIDLALGRACFESHRADLPPGTQYEGIKGLVGDQLTIRIMNGVEVVTIDCTLNADGVIQGSGQ